MERFDKTFSFYYNCSFIKLNKCLKAHMDQFDRCDITVLQRTGVAIYRMTD